jgi:hypothetical protein
LRLWKLRVRKIDLWKVDDVSYVIKICQYKSSGFLKEERFVGLTPVFLVRKPPSFRFLIIKIVSAMFPSKELRRHLKLGV